MSVKSSLVALAACLLPSCAALAPTPSPTAASFLNPMVSAAAPLSSATISPTFFAPRQRSVGVERQNLNFIVGQKSLSDDAWEPNEDQTVYGLNFDYYKVDQLVGLDAGLMYSTDSSDGGIGQTTELFAGARKTFTVEEIWHPYVAAGLAYIWGTNGADAGPLGPAFSDLVLADQGDSVGVYLRGGAYATVAEHINLGLDLRTLQGTSLGGKITDDADSFQIAFTVGWGF